MTKATAVGFQFPGPLPDPEIADCEYRPSARGDRDLPKRKTRRRYLNCEGFFRQTGFVDRRQRKFDVAAKTGAAVWQTGRLGSEKVRSRLRIKDGG